MQEGGLGFVMRRNSNDDQVFGRQNSMEDHHSRLRRQMVEEMGREVEAPPPLHQPQGGAVPWHHRSGPIGGGLNIVPAEEAAALRRAMPRVLMPGEPIPPLDGGVSTVPAEGPTTLRGAMQRIVMHTAQLQSHPNKEENLEGRAASATGRGVR